MPSLSPTMEKGNLVKWCKSIGDEINVGDVIAEIDTDKATMEVESLHKGILAKIIIAEGTHDVPVKSPIALLKQKNDTDEDIENFKVTEESSETTPVQIPEVVNNVSTAEKAEVTEQDKVYASPLARKIAIDYGIDISTIIHGSGPGGRIVKADVLNYKKTPGIPLEKYIDEKASSLRLAIAAKLTKCKQEVPHFYVQTTANVTDIIAILEKLKKSAAIDVKITINEFVIKAAAIAMAEYPEVNISWNSDNTIRHYNSVDISVAVAVNGGIYTPVVRQANTKSIIELAREIRVLAAKAKEGKLKLEEYTGGSITTSNLGMCNIDCFYPIINPPQGSILSISRALEAPVINKTTNTIDIGYTLTIGYAVDHRVIDGLIAGKFLGRIKELLENPILIMAR